jgi:hypothetical protein
VNTRFALIWAFLLAMVAGSIAGAQPAPSNPTALCAADCDRCAADFSGEFSSTPSATVPQSPCALGAASNRGNCAASCLPARLCAPTVITPGDSRNITLNPGQSVTITCSLAAPRRPSRQVINQQLVVTCDESLGAITSEELPGTCGCNPIEGYATPRAVVVSEHVVGRHLVASYRVSPTAREVTMGCLYVPTGTPRPSNEAELITGLRTDVTALQTDVTGIRTNVSGIQGQLNGVDGRVGVLEQARAATPATPVSTFRARFDLAAGVLFHWNSGSPLGAMGAGGFLRPGIILRWTDSVALRIYGGPGMVGQTNTPYRVRLPNGTLLDQTAPIFAATFGVDAILGSGTVAAILGVDGFVAGRSAPTLGIQGNISGLLAIRADVHAGARFRIAGSNNGAQLNLDALLNGGFSNISGVAGGQFFSPSAFGLGGEVALAFTY